MSHFYDIKDSLKTILTLSTRVKILYKQFSYLKNNLKHLDSINISEHEQEIPLCQFLVATTLEMMFITSESILEEYNDILTHVIFPKYESQIKHLKADIKPAMKRFNRWTNRRQYRNTLIAHNLRWKDRSSLFSSEEKVGINAPHYDNDFVVIYYLHVFMCHCLGKHFKDEIAGLNQEMIIDKIEYSSEYKSLREELPIINSWALENGFEIIDLQEHIMKLNTK